MSQESKLEQLKQDIAAIGKSRPVRVLIVDDDKDSRMLIRDLLEPYNVVVLEASNGVDALQALSLEKYDVVLLDVKMPHMNGIEAHKAIKAKWPSVRVFICTAYLEWPGLETVLEDGCVQIISKNFLEKSLAEIFEPLCKKQTT